MKGLYIKFIKRFKVEILIGVILSLILSEFISANIFYIALVPSASMETTFMVGDRLLVTKDIDTLEIGEIYNDYVYINDKKLYEPYVSSTMVKEINVDLVVPEGKYYFLGDNRNNSNDDVIGKNPLYIKRT